MFTLYLNLSLHCRCRDTFCSPSPKCKRYWLNEPSTINLYRVGQRTALINLTTASMDLEDNQARTRNVELNELIIRGGKFSYKSIKQVTNITLIAIVFFSIYSWIPIHEGPLTLYSSL